MVTIEQLIMLTCLEACSTRSVMSGGRWRAHAWRRVVHGSVMSKVEGTCLEACSTQECHVEGGGHMLGGV